MSKWSELRLFVEGLRAGGNTQLSSQLKPLMLLVSLGRIQRLGERLHLFQDIEKELSRAIRLFGKPGTRPNPQFPFYRLKNDKVKGNDVWEFTSELPMRTRQSNDDFPVTELRSAKAKAGFVPWVFDALHSDADLLVSMALRILNSFFPSSIHPEVLAATGLSVEAQRGSIYSHSDFCEKVHTAYKFQCAVFGCELRLHGLPIGLTPTMIRWAQHGGKLEMGNVLLLSPYARYLFDMGCISADPASFRLKVSKAIDNITGASHLLDLFDGKSLLLPSDPEDWPSSANLQWHRYNLFRG